MFDVLKDSLNSNRHLLNDIKECPTCKETTKSNPTPDGDDICPNCGDRELMDKE